MSDDRSSVFISSTFTDLAAERAAVADAAEKAGLRPLRWEDVPVTVRSPQEVLTEHVAQADLFVVIVAFRYGFVRSEAGGSGVEQELERAKAKGVPIFVYLLAEDAPWSRTQIAVGAEFRRLQKFRTRLSKEFVVRYFRSTSDLAAQAFADFVRWKSDPRFVRLAEDTRDATSSLESILLEIRSQLALLVERSITESSIPSERLQPNITPSDFLGPATLRNPDPNRAFVVMPYSMEWSAPVERVIREVCEAEGITFDIAKAKEGRFIIHDIWQGITSAAITIADLTGGNPNVAYEVGLADVLGRKVILISQETDVPVDFRGARLIIYKNSINGALTLREDLSTMLRRIRSTTPS